ncbi:MAG: Tungstate uptake system permease protein TupB [Gammaproteobacteria bacterium]|nr:Tungstate uptake system permease protein TupB [Gammaproteobacteria bacterium]
MNDLGASFATAFRLLLSLDPDLLQIVGLSLYVSVSAVAIASFLGMPFGALVAMTRFPGRGALVIVLNAFMGLPPVVAGLFVYLMLSRAGPLGDWGLLFTPSAMIAAQTLLVLPIVAALTHQTIGDLHIEYDEYLRSLRMGRVSSVLTLLWEGRYSLFTAALAGFGRAIAEVGAVMIVGGNINHVTRVMTTSIALETMKGNLALALGLGVVLLAIVALVNALAFELQRWTRQWQGA